MKILRFFASLLLLLFYSYLAFVLLDQGDINSRSIHESKLYQEYDYIVVGAGSAGSVVASRLAQNGYQVLVLESGVSDNVLEVKMPLGFGAIINRPDLKEAFLWGNNAKFEKDGYSKEIDFPRAKLIGGCGSINANIWNKGHKKIYDKWAEMGAKNWNYDNIKSYFKKAEDTLWINNNDRFIHQSMKDVLAEGAKIIGRTEINTKQEGMGIYETTMRNGRRWSSADAYLKPTLRVFPDKLHLKLNTTVVKVLFNKENTKAVGVLLANNRTIKAKKEVILSAGAFGSPAILMRSGVGDKDKLEKIGIKVVRELPGVGENLQDHPTTSFIVRTNESRWADNVKPGPPSASNLAKYFLFGSGSFSSNIAEIGGYITTKYAQFSGVSDIQFHCAPLFFGTVELQKEQMKANRKEDYITCGVSIVTARDKGSVHLKSLDLNDPIQININFLQYEEDVEALLEGYKVVDKIFNSPSFKAKVEYYFPSEAQLKDKQKIKSHFYESLFEVYHPTGTCKMGDVQKDVTAVVDHNLLVKGFENLRVIDASIMPEIVNSNTNAPTIMIAERGVDLIMRKNR